MKKQNAMVKIVRTILLSVMLGMVSVVAANAEEVFVANLDGQQVIPSNNTTGKGFAVLVVNEFQAKFQLYFQGLHSLRTTGAIHFPGTAGENVAPNLPIIFGNSPSSLGYATSTIGLTPQELQHLKNGLWYIKINSEMFPNGEIRGQFQPYSPLIAKLSGSQTVPANPSTAAGAVYFALNRDETLMVYYYKYQGLSQGPVKLCLYGATAGQNGVWETDLTALNPQPTDEGISYRHTGGGGSQAFIDRLKRGLVYAIVSTEQAVPVGEIRGQVKPMNKTTDFDGDNRADISVYRENTGVWYQINSVDNQAKATQFGILGDTPAHADYDGDGVTDIAVYRQSSGHFYALRSADNVIQIVHWGKSGDKPAVADFDGDGKADYVVVRDNGQRTEYWIMGSSNNSIRRVEFGLFGDKFLPADFDGDRINDLTVYRPSNQTYYSLLSSDGSYRIQKWGIGGDIGKISDFDGDGISEYVVYRTGGQEAGTWWILYNTGVVAAYKFGLGTDRPVPSDYDGDGRTDFAVYRNGNWWIRKSSNGAVSVTNFGLSNDLTITQ